MWTVAGADPCLTRTACGRSDVQLIVLQAYTMRTEAEQCGVRNVLPCQAGGGTGSVQVSS
jgi:hypothetical protein